MIYEGVENNCNVWGASFYWEQRVKMFSQPPTQKERYKNLKHQTKYRKQEKKKDKTYDKY